jgi:hypothetical protein
VYLKYITFEFTPPPLSFASLFPEQFQQGSLLYLHTCVYIFCSIFTLLLLSPLPPTSHWCQPSPSHLAFVLGIFKIRSHKSQVISLGWFLTTILLISASCVARITGVSHQHSVGPQIPDLSSYALSCRVQKNHPK